MTTKTKKTTKKTAPKSTIDPKILLELAAVITEHGNHNLLGLQHRLETENELKLVENPQQSGRFSATMAGVTADGTGGAGVALSNWANKARREAAKVK